MTARARVWPAPALSAEQAEQAAPFDGARPLNPDGASVVAFRNGPGDNSYMPGVDEWADPLVYKITRDGVELGDALRVVNPGPTPPEGHGGWDIPAAEYPPIVNSATRIQALFVSDWNASTAAKGLSGSFTGEHVTIRRIRPGSDRGYMPSQMLPANQARALPGPWDAALVIGGETSDTVLGGV